MKIFIAILIAKILRIICRLLKRGGTGLPGRIALKICPDLLSVLSKNVRCVVVSGTNGKTTSVHMIEQGFRNSGLSYFANLTGANLIEGITTDFIVNSTLLGKCKKDYAVLEMDEFASREVCRQIQPAVIFVTNLFVDQVERFGGVSGSRNGLADAVRSSPDSVLILNADDSVSASLGLDVPNRVIYYGVSMESAMSHGYSGSSDVPECICCGSKLDFNYMTYSHLGDFFCSNCGYSHSSPDYLIKSIISSDMNSSSIGISTPSGSAELSINLPEMYNMYNAVGAYAAMIEMGLSSETAKNALSSFKCGFGRMESFPQLGKCGGKMVLVKNGAGCDQVIQFLKKYTEEFVLCIYLNNNVSDGVDITWLEIADFESLNSCKISKIFVSGMRMEEMYSRLIKAGIDSTIIVKEQNCRSLVSALKDCDKPVFILPTYTGMMATRSEIVRQCGGQQYWEGK